jgi:ABC-type iron transport system FetAB permease component
MLMHFMVRHWILGRHVKNIDNRTCHLHHKLGVSIRKLFNLVSFAFVLLLIFNLSFVASTLWLILHMQFLSL